MTGFTFVLGIVFAMSARVNSGRAIELEVVVDAPPATIYALWTTPEGIAKFFAPTRMDRRARNCGRSVRSRPGSR